MTKLIVMILTIPWIAGCTLPRRHPSTDLARSLLPALPAASEAEVDQLLAQRVAFAAPVRAAVVWLDGSVAESSLPDAERVALLQSFTSALKRGPFSAVTTLPTLPVRAGEPGSAAADTVDLRRLLGAAARFQADVLVLLETESEEYVDWNPLALSYLALLPRLFVPGDQLSVYTSAEACVLDVRTGVFLGCAQGRGRSKRWFAFPMLREGNLRALSVSSTAEAVRDLPDPLRLHVGARMDLGAAASRLRRTEVSGVPYTTE